MSQFRFKARDKSGKAASGAVESASEEEALKSIREKDLFPVSLDQVDDKAPKKNFFGKTIIKHDDLLMFTRQLSALTKAGVPVISALDILSEEVGNSFFKLVIIEMRQDIVAGHTLTQAVRKHPDYFPPIYASFIDAGEQSGMLDMVLDRLENLLKHEEDNRKTIKSALRYPKMIVLAIVGAVFIIMTFVIPKFTSIFKATKMTLPLPTRIMIGVSGFFQAYWLYILSGLFVAWLAFKLWLKTKNGRIVWGRMILTAPVIGPLLVKSMMSRFTFIFSTAIESGMPLMKVFEVSSGILQNAFVSRELEEVKKGVRDGKSIGASLARSAIFPTLVKRMISVGERSGSLPKMLTVLIEHYEGEVKFAVDAMSQVLEQILTVIMAVVVLVLALAVFLPIWNMISIAQR